MLILGIDTTTKYTEVAVSENGKLLAHKEAELGRTQSDLLPQFVDEVLQQAGKILAEIDYICTANGPGYYTGIRTGIAYAAALAKALGKKVITVSTLETFVYDLSAQDGIYVPVIKARYDSVYAAVYKAEKGSLTQLFAPAYIAVSELAGSLKDMPQALLVGRDATQYEELTALPNKLIERDFAPDGQIALIGEKYADTAVLPEAVRGNYLREPDIGATR